MSVRRTNRQKLTPRERVKLYAKQKGLCGCGCGERLNADGKGEVGEHVWWFVALGNIDKPDALYRAECAKRKTNGPRGDLNTISHIKQLAEGRTQHDRRNERGYSLIQGKTKIENRGFDKKLRKHMDGSVSKR